jgi:Icc-related predicted phosphoesterase
MKILAVGDIHSNFNAFNTLIEVKQPDIVFQCGDNGYFWVGKQAKGLIKPGNSKVYLIPGNHEDWNMYESIVGRHSKHPVEVESNVFYCPIGSIIELNGKRVMFLGGADSIDKRYRTFGYDYFPQEILDQKDLDFVLSQNKVDIIISHTCPSVFEVPKYSFTDMVADPTRKVLDIVLEKLKPDLWIFGHWHEFLQGRIDNTNWYGLNKAIDGNWWMDFIL